MTTRRSSVHILLLLSVDAKDARGPGDRERGGNWDQLLRNRSHPINTVTSAVLWLLSSRDLVAVTRLLRTRRPGASAQQNPSQEGVADQTTAVINDGLDDGLITE